MILANIALEQDPEYSSPKLENLEIVTIAHGDHLPVSVCPYHTS